MEQIKQQVTKDFELYADMLYRYVLFRVSSKEVAEDLVQDVFVKYIEYLAGGKQALNSKAFLITSCRNAVIDYYRKKKTQSLDVLRDAGFEPKIDETIQISAEARELLSFLSQLKEEDQELIAMRFMAGLEPKEIAEVLEVSANVVSVRLNRALSALKTIAHVDHE